jgi:hypothetical protein
MDSTIQHCIIAGAPRCGTTSLFNVLGKQNNISASHVKQTLFFLDRGYGGTELLKRESDYTKSEYMRYFPFVSEAALTLEATPDYIYSAGTARRINECLGEQVQLVFVLRHPIERAISCFYHERQVGSVSPEISIEEFLGLHNKSFESNKYIHQGKYHEFLEEYYDVFGKEFVTVIFTEELTDLNNEGLRNLSERLLVNYGDLINDNSAQNNARFSNRSIALLIIYRHIRKSVLLLTQKNRVMAKLLAIPVALGSALYKKVNKAKVIEGNGLSAQQYAELNAYYTDSYTKLTQLTGREIPWG